MIEEDVLKFVREKKACYISDVARQFNLSNHGAKDIVLLLQINDKITMEDKGIAKLIMPKAEK